MNLSENIKRKKSANRMYVIKKASELRRKLRTYT